MRCGLCSRFACLFLLPTDLRGRALRPVHPLAVLKNLAVIDDPFHPSLRFAAMDELHQMVMYVSTPFGVIVV